MATVHPLTQWYWRWLPAVVSQEGTDTFITTAIPPTMVTTANFFVGFLISHAAGQFPAASGSKRTNSQSFLGRCDRKYQ